MRPHLGCVIGQIIAFVRSKWIEMGDGDRENVFVK